MHPQHIEVPRLGAELELQVLAYATAIATWDLSPICDLHHSSQLHRVPNPLSEARDWTCNLIDTSQIHFCCTIMGTPTYWFLKSFIFFQHMHSHFLEFNLNRYSSCSFWSFELCSMVWLYLEFFFFRAAPAAYVSFQARGGIRAVAASLHNSHSNTVSVPCLWHIPQLMAMPGLTHWARPVIEPMFSWILVGFVTAEPQ